MPVRSDTVLSVPTTIQLSEAELADRLAEVLDRGAKGERIAVHREGKEIAIIASSETVTAKPPPIMLPPRPDGSDDDDDFLEFLRSINEYRKAMNMARYEIEKP